MLTAAHTILVTVVSSKREMIHKNPEELEGTGTPIQDTVELPKGILHAALKYNMAPV